MKPGRRTFLAAGALASAALMLVGVGGASAQSKFPSKPVELVVPFKPGGGTDRSARIFASFLSTELGVPVKIINIAGGGGWVAWAQMAKWDASKDDHKIGYVNIPHVLSMHDPRMKRKETLKSFNFVSGHTLDPCIWAIRTDDPRFSDLKSFIDYVKKNPMTISVSTTAVGSDDHQGLAYAEKFIKGFQVKKVYANGDSKKLREVIGKHTDAVAGNVGYYIPYMLEGKIKAIAVLDTQRSEYLPTVPTFEEITGLQNVSFAGRTLAVAPGLAEDKKKVYADAIKKAVENPNYAIKELKNKNGLWPVTGAALWKKLEETSDNVKKVKYWEMKP
jgi:tripartite-type tricarboxylate transporter receptor subunit TctC